MPAGADQQKPAQPLILHADNGNAMRAATLNCRLEELGDVRSFSRPRVSNDTPYSESQFLTVKIGLMTPGGPSAARKRPAAGPVHSWTGSTNYKHRHSSSRYATPDQWHSGQAVELCRHRALVYEQARQRDPAVGAAALAAGISLGWSGSIQRHRKTPSIQLHWPWPPDRRQEGLIQSSAGVGSAGAAPLPAAP